MPSSLSVCDSLIQEHRQFESLLAQLQDALKATSGQERAKQMMQQIAQHMDTHFSCEEKALFPAVSNYQPMMLMEAEHEELMALRDTLLEHLLQDITPIDTLTSLIPQFVEAMLDHISREDAGIFPLAEQVLSDAEKTRVIADMTAIRQQAT